MSPLPLSFSVLAGVSFLVQPLTTPRVLVEVMRYARPMEARGSKFHPDHHTPRHPIKAALNRLRSLAEVLTC